MVQRMKRIKYQKNLNLQLIVFQKTTLNIFVLETLSNTTYIKEITEYIKEKSKESFVLTQFAVKPDGFSRDGISVNRIFKYISSLKSIDAYGLNCGMGPTSIYEVLKNFDFNGKIISVLPNAGYPMVIQERTVYTNNPEYFAKKMEKIKSFRGMYYWWLLWN